MAVTRSNGGHDIYNKNLGSFLNDYFSWRVEDMRVVSCQHILYLVFPRRVGFSLQTWFLDICVREIKCLHVFSLVEKTCRLNSEKLRVNETLKALLLLSRSTIIVKSNRNFNYESNERHFSSGNQSIILVHKPITRADARPMPYFNHVQR